MSLYTFVSYKSLLSYCKTDIFFFTNTVCVYAHNMDRRERTIGSMLLCHLCAYAMNYTFYLRNDVHHMTDDQSSILCVRIELQSFIFAHMVFWGTVCFCDDQSFLFLLMRPWIICQFLKLVKESNWTFPGHLISLVYSSFISFKDQSTDPSN